MSKKSNDSIEEFFKKGVRKSDITFRESDWQKMERMLDEKAMVGSASSSRPWKRIIGGAVIVALLSSLYFLIPGNEEASLSSLNEKVAANKNVDAVDNNKDANKITLPSNDPTKEAVSNTDASDRPQSKAQNISGDKKSSIELSAQSPVNSNRSGSTSKAFNQRKSGSDRNNQKTLQQTVLINPTKSRSQAEGNNSISRKDKQLTSNTLTNESPSDATEKESNEEGSSLIITESTQPATITSEPIRAAQLVRSNEQEQKQSTPVPSAQGEKVGLANNSSAKPEATITSDIFNQDTAKKEDTVQVVTREEKLIDPAADASKPEEGKDKTITPSRWSVAFVFAPEFSSTSFDKQTVPGSAYGLTIGYRILDRLTISAGVIKTHKKYVGYGEDYQPPAGYWQFRTNGIVPDEVSGQCSVIEVPLMLQFDVLRREKSRLFAAAGASSYRMLNEAYAYTFNEPNDGAADGWSTDQPSTYYFSVGHVSLGYDHRLYRGLYLGIEPYVKIPFGGIGWSNVNLLTMGAYVNVRYKFSKRN
jgi:hypothetical protein